MRDGPVLPNDESGAAEVFGAILEGVEDHRKIETQTVSHLRIEPRWQLLPAFVRGFQAKPTLLGCYREPRNNSLY
jgi:hypothetical protein